MSPLDLRMALEGTNRSEHQLRAIVDILPTQIWSGADQGSNDTLHPEDQEPVRELWWRISRAGEAVRR